MIFHAILELKTQIKQRVVFVGQMHLKWILSKFMAIEEV